jgi:hypothetical protein
MISKLALLLGKSDFFLRILPACWGIVTIYLLYRIVRLIVDEDTALLSAAFLSVNGLYLLLSREIRPYTLLVVLFLVAWRLIIALSEEGRWRDLALLCGVNTVLFCLHYFSFHMVFAQGAVLMLCMLSRNSPFDFKKFATFCVFTAIVASWVYIYFFLPSAGSHSILRDSQGGDRSTLSLISDYLGQAAFFFTPIWARWTAGALALAGLVTLTLTRPKQAVICVLLLFLPLTIVLAMDTKAYFSPWHVAYFTPFLAFFSATALARLPGRKIMAAVIAVGGASFILLSQHARYYETDSYRHPVFVTLYKSVAEQLAAVLSPDAVTVSSDPGFANGIRWYLDQSSDSNQLRSQDLGPGGGKATLQFISAHNDFGTLGKDETSFLTEMGRPETIEKVLNATVYTFHLDRQPIPRIERSPSEFIFSAQLKKFYGSVYRLKNVTSCPMPRVGVTATRNDQPGSFEFVLDNSAGDKPLNFFVNLQYLNVGAGNQLGLFYRFDDEAIMPLAGTTGPDFKHQLQVSFSRERPFKRLTFFLELNCRGNTALYQGGNLETLAFKELEVFTCSRDDAASCQAVWERRYIESQRCNYTKEKFLTSSSTSHTPHWESISNLSDNPAQEKTDWRILTPKAPGEPGVLTVDIKPKASTVFYPRLSGSDSSIQIFEVHADGSLGPVFMMAGVPLVWTPVSAQYPLVLPDGPAARTLRIEMRGRYCQLWHKGGNIFF